MNLTAMRHERIRGDGIDLHAEVAGEGPPVILLHGFPENIHSWQRQVAPLAAAGFTVWVPALRGYPPSGISSERGAYHLRHLVRDVAAIVKHTGYPRAHVAGHDWGGIIAWTFAGAYPELLDKLIILNAPHMQIYAEKVWRTSQMFKSLYVAFFLLPFLPERAIAAGDFRVVRRMFSHMPARKNAFSKQDIDRYIHSLSCPGALKAALDYYRANIGWKSTAIARSARTDAPTLVIWGMRDPALGPFLLDGLERFVPHVEVHRIPGDSHWVQNEAPEEVSRAMVAFLCRA